MASQAKSGFSTEGTQYATDSSYYLLDTVPGSGSVIEGPVTVTNNLTVTGSETVQGALGVAGNITAPGLFAAAGAAVTVTGVGSNSLALAANGDIRLVTGTVPGTPADRITITNAAVPATLADLDGLDIAASGVVTLQSGPNAGGALVLRNKGAAGTQITNDCAGSSMLIQNTTASASLNVLNSGTGNLNITQAGTGNLALVNSTVNSRLQLQNTVGPIQITGSGDPANFIHIGSGDSANGVNLISGLACTGSYASPEAIVGPTYNMATNKAWLSTDPGQNIFIIRLPFNLAVGNRGVILVQAQSARQYAPISVSSDGSIINMAFLPGSGVHFFTVVVF